MTDYLGADCFAVAVSPHRRDHRADERVHAVETHLNFAQNLHIEARLLEGDDPAETLVDFARRNQISQVLVLRPVYVRSIPGDIGCPEAIRGTANRRKAHGSLYLCRAAHSSRSFHTQRARQSDPRVETQGRKSVLTEKVYISIARRQTWTNTILV